jgi:hypothetical protein
VFPKNLLHPSSGQMEAEDRLLQNVGIKLLSYMASQPRILMHIAI